ncbi:MAG: HD domain-containing protein [Bacteroidetes bacterium]|nr:HD domain-containing protein [Bacteroidota bacterium]
MLSLPVLRLRIVNQNKIINDPVHGFIEIPRGIILDLIDTDVFQRLRRIQQLALSSLVYPGAVHSRFNHCIGAMHLTGQALDVLRSKGATISPEEYEATLIAILLHDIGHGPFSHALESVILQGLHHERMSKALMQHLNQRFHGKLTLAIQIFEGTYPRKFLHQLVSSQLDMDRLDYLKRDSYFTGVVEGLVSASRIIKTLNVVDDRIVVESKGIYSVEKFIVARRLMYWQVYLHRAVLAGEYMIVNILKRAKELMYGNHKLWKTEALEFLFGQNTLLEPTITPEIIQRYIELDDNDIMVAIKQWRHSGDKVLEILCDNLLQRKLLKARLQDTPFPEAKIQELRADYRRRLGLNDQEIKYFVFSGDISNMAYVAGPQEPIEIVHKDGTIENISTASDMHNIMALSSPVKKYFICYPTW